MNQEELEQKIEKARLNRVTNLYSTYDRLTILPDSIGNLYSLIDLSLHSNQLSSLPDSIGNLINLTSLNLANNQLSTLPDSIGNLINLRTLNIANNQLSTLPDSIGNLINLRTLNIANNQLSTLPDSISNLINLRTLDIDSNQLKDLPLLRKLPDLEKIVLRDRPLPQRYWKSSNWKAEWLLDEENAEIRRTLIERVGYEKICEELNAVPIDSWREYTLLKIYGVDPVYITQYIGEDENTEDGDILSHREPMLLLKMTCPSTQHIHILRVPPEMTSAEAAITWINHGIHPDEFAVQT